jgi:hypothetical protein
MLAILSKGGSIRSRKELAYRDFVVTDQPQTAVNRSAHRVVKGALNLLSSKGKFPFDDTMIAVVVTIPPKMDLIRRMFTTKESFSLNGQQKC